MSDSTYRLTIGGESVEGAAARAGVQGGDVILQIGNQAVTDARQFVEVAQRAARDGRAVSVLVRRGELVNFLLIKP